MEFNYFWLQGNKKEVSFRFLQEAEDEFKKVMLQTTLNSTIEENCNQLKNRLALGFYM